MGYLKHALRPPQVTQPVLAQVDEPVLLGQRVVEQLFRRGRHDDLSAVRHRHQPLGAIHRAAAVVAVADLGLAGMDPHPDAHGLRDVPVVREQRTVVRQPQP